MPDAKLSALSAAVTVADTDVAYITDGVTSEKVSLGVLKEFFDQTKRNSSTASQAPAAATDTYLAGSAIAIPTGRLGPRSQYRAWFRVVKTAAGTVAPVINLRLGTSGSGAVGDSSRATLTFAAQTAVADTGIIEVRATFRSLGSGTSAVIEATGTLTHGLATTGLATVALSAPTVVGGGFDSTAATVIGLSLNTGTSAAWTINQLQADLVGLN